MLMVRNITKLTHTLLALRPGVGQRHGYHAGGGAVAGATVTSGFVSGTGLATSRTLGSATAGHPTGGATLGAGLAQVIGRQLANTDFGRLAGGAQIPIWAWWGLPAWLAALALLALAWPAGLIARTRPVDYRAL